MKHHKMTRLILFVKLRKGYKKVLFANTVMKFTSTGKMKRRILLVTDFIVYIIDPESPALKSEIALVAIEKLCLSKLSDNFLAIIIPTEYDLLMASTRKTKITTVLVDATRSQSDYELDVLLSNRSRVQQKTSWQEGLPGTNWPILSSRNWTYKFQVKIMLRPNSRSFKKQVG